MEILAILPESMGDFILVTPSLQSIEKYFTKEEIGWITPDAILPLAKLSVLKGTRIPLSSYDTIKKELPDLTLCFPPASKFLLLTRKVGGKNRIGYVHEKMFVPRLLSRFCLTKRWICPEQMQIHELEAYAKILELIDIPVERKLPLLSVPIESCNTALNWLKAHQQTKEQKIVVLHLNGRWKINPLDLFSFISSSENLLLVAMFSKEEEKEAMQLIYESSVACVTPGPVPLDDYAAFLSSCDLFVGTDGGPVHIASALSKPVIAVYFESDFSRHTSKWHPWQEQYTCIDGTNKTQATQQFLAKFKQFLKE